MDMHVRHPDRPFRLTSLASIVIGLSLSSSTWAAPTERTVNYTYHPAGSNGAGQVATMNGSRTDVSDITSYAYDASGNLISTTNPLSHVVQMTDYNGRGLPGKTIDANGVETVLTYHVRGWLTSSTVKHPGGPTSLDAVTTFDYDAVGQVTRITSPDGSYLDFEYDAAQRLEAIQNNLGERIEYSLDAAGNRTQEVIKNSSSSIVKTQTRVFDELSRLMDDIGAGGQTIHYDYDKNDNPTQITDARTNPTGQAFDALNRLITQTDPDNFDVGYTYDDQDRIKTVTDQRGLVTTYNYDAFGNLTSLVSPDTGTTTYDYDNAGNRIKKTDAKGIVTDYTYDALNRLLTVSYPASPTENVTYTYDDTSGGNYGKGRLTRINDESGQIDFTYDHRANLIQKTYSVESTNYSTAYQYDLANNLTQITYPSGRIVDYTRDTAGRVSGIITKENAGATAETVISNVTYLPFGPIASYTYGNGMTHTMNYDQDYRVTDIESLGTTTKLDLNYAYDPNSNITALNDQDDPNHDQSFQYDKLNRIEQAIGDYGTLDYQYDGIGNRTQETTNDGVTTTTDTYTYSSTSNQLNQIDSDDGTTQTQRTLNYDANGNLIQDNRADGTIIDLGYNDANRYRILDKDSTPTAVYLYNALGQRTGKVATTGQLNIDEHYHYDESGLRLAVTDTTGTAQQEYIYLDTIKVAMLADTSPPPTDTDSDGIPDTSDNCPNDANPNQTDTDSDTIGNVCDPEQATFISIAAEDGWVRESNETSNVGGNNDTVGAGNRALRVGDNSSDQQYKFIVSFDLSTLGALNSITSTTLELTFGKITGDVSSFGTASVDLATGGFNSNPALENADFETAPTTTNTATLNEGTTATASINATGQTDILTAHNQGTSNVQLRIQYSLDDNDDRGNDYSGYYSSNNSNSANHPKLIIDYTLAD